MTSDDAKSRRVADELKRDDRQARQPEAAPAILAAMLEKHEDEVARIVGQAEAACAAKIDAFAAALGAAAESLQREFDALKASLSAREVGGLSRINRLA